MKWLLAVLLVFTLSACEIQTKTSPEFITPKAHVEKAKETSQTTPQPTPISDPIEDSYISEIEYLDSAIDLLDEGLVIIDDVIIWLDDCILDVSLYIPPDSSEGHVAKAQWSRYSQKVEALPVPFGYEKSHRLWIAGNDKMAQALDETIYGTEHLDADAISRGTELINEAADLITQASDSFPQ